jgi:FecR protein
MGSRTMARSILSCSFLFALSAGMAAADSSHARVIRLSLVQGDVRFTREAHGDPLADQKAQWETAQANLPVRQGYVVATDNGRAEVEFENGAMAFLNENSVLEFFDLSLDDGARTTRLVLRQGSASFYVNPSSGDYFSVTGGDFTVEANGKGSFRINNFDDGSNVEVLTGHASVLHKKETTLLSKGHSLSMKAGEDTVNIGRLPADDDFDHWVSGRIDTVSTATNASLQYTNSPYYLPGYADLYTYGAWSSCGGYGYGWRPFGASLGWSPFTMGQWIWDPGFGWTFASYQPWGWAPYHYGGWLFEASCGGWFYSPPAYYGVYGGNPRKRLPPIVHPPHPLYRATTAVFVRQNGKLGVVPMHPLDKNGKTPLNLEHGVFSTEPARNPTAPVLSAAGGQKWETVKSPTHDALTSSLIATTAPVRTSRTTLEGSSGTRIVSLSHDSSIVYDPREHRFVNTNTAPSSGAAGTEAIAEKNAPGGIRNDHIVNNPIVEGPRNKPPSGTPTRVPVTPTSARSTAPPSRTSPPPPPAPRTSSGGGGYRGGTESAGGGSSRGSSAPSAPAPHASAPSPSSGGGGRPH